LISAGLVDTLEGERIAAFGRLRSLEPPTSKRQVNQIVGTYHLLSIGARVRGTGNGRYLRPGESVVSVDTLPK
jgi:hypothetical protein